MSYSTCVYLHGYCSSFIIILLISSLSDSHHSSLFLSSQLSLIYKVDQLLLLLRRRSHAPQTWRASGSELLWLWLCRCCCDCCCRRSMNQWLDFVVVEDRWIIVVVEDRWISGQILLKGCWLGVGVDEEDEVVGLDGEDEREGNNKKCKKNEYFIK